MLANLTPEFENSKDPSFKQSRSAQEIFEKVMVNELPVFVEIQDRALEMTLADLHGRHPSYQNRNSKPNRMNENIRGLLFDQFPDEMKETESRRFYFEKPGEYIILFKKLKSNFMPTNISTRTTRRILQQLGIEFTDEKPIVFIGYIMNKAWDEIKQQCAVYISAGKIVWITDLRRFDKGLTTTSLFPQTPEDDAPLVVRPKNRDPEGKQLEN